VAVTLTGRCPGAGTSSPGTLRRVFERFTDRARRVLVLAQEEARLLNHGFIGTEHLLLGLVSEGEGVAAKALESLGVSLEAVRERVEETIGIAGSAPRSSPPFTPRAKKVLEFSLREALQLNHSYIGTEHLLLGLVREGEGVAATVLQSLGADLVSVRQTTLSLIGGAPDPWEPTPVEFERAQPPWAGRGWVAPTWDRPSEGTVPVVMAIDAFVLQNDVAVVNVGHLEVYPNGFTVNLLTRVNPRKVREAMELLAGVGPHRWPHVTIRFADGRTATVGPSGPSPQEDTQGVPTEPIVRVSGRGGWPNGWRTSAWVFPLPPDGPLEILVSHEALGLAESSITVDGAAVRGAAERAKVIWT
jgi:hypothetical protein